MSKIIREIDRFFTKRYKTRRSVFSESIECLEKNGHEKIVPEWIDFCTKISAAEEKCVLGLSAFWFKFPVLIKDFTNFEGKEVIDVGGMCGLSSFLAYHVGKADSVMLVEHNEEYCSPCRKLLGQLSNNRITVHQESTADFFKKYTIKNNTVIYLSDILYQFRQPELDVLSEAIKKAPLILAHSRENRPTRQKNKYKFSRHQNIAKYLSELGKKVSYPNVKNPESIRTKEYIDSNGFRTAGPKPSKVDPWETWVTVVGE